MFKLMDGYERKARLLPALIVALPLAVGVKAFTQGTIPWYMKLGGGAGLGTILAVALSYFAGVAGRRLEQHLWTDWGEPPTTRWLRPSDTTRSGALKAKWRRAIRTLTGMTIPPAPREPGGTGEAEFDRIVRDAVLQLRHRLRGLPAARMVEIHNIDYGFYRNLAGMNRLWVGTSAMGLIACAIAFGLGMRPFIALALEITSLGASVLAIAVLPGQVKHAAERYAEALFAAAALVAAEEVKISDLKETSRPSIHK